jgi:hypothetical protein
LKCRSGKASGQWEQNAPFPETNGALVKATDVAIQKRSIADFERVVELQPGNHITMAYLYLSLRLMARFEVLRRRDYEMKHATDAGRERALSAAAANHANRLIPYLPSSAPRTMADPLLDLQTNGAVELIILERIDKVSVSLRLVRGPKEPRLYYFWLGTILGTVCFTALSAKDGTIQNWRPMSGHPTVIVFSLDIAKYWVQEHKLERHRALSRLPLQWKFESPVQGCGGK